MISQELEKYGYALSDLNSVYPEIKVDFNFSSLEDMYASVGYKSVTINQIANYCLKNDERKNALTGAPVVVDGVSHASNLVFSKCCCPVLGDGIVAVASKSGISIHTKNCSNLKNFDSSKIMSASWKKDVDRLFDVNIKFVAKDSVGFASRILGIISKADLDMSKIMAKKLNESDCEFEIGVKVKNNKQLDELIEKLQRQESIKTINRSFD